MRLVEALVHPRGMKAPMDKVDHHISQKQESKNTKDQVKPAARHIVDVMVDSGMSTLYQHTKGRHQDRHHRDRTNGNSNFNANLFVEILRQSRRIVCISLPPEEIEKTQPGEEKIKEIASHNQHDISRQKLDGDRARVAALGQEGLLQEYSQALGELLGAHCGTARHDERAVKLSPR